MNYADEKGVSVTGLAGGNRGPLAQVTTDAGYVQLTPEQALVVADGLLDWYRNLR
ncbi:MAG TPA: hypothetical protein VIX73_23110 [Kofleriaceae bacterium]